MKNIAFVGTEYQQNILFSICLQNNITIDTLFLREDISIQKGVDRYVRDVIYFKNISFSWRSMKKYYQTYQEKIAPNLSKKEEYRVFVWSLYNPLSRYAINFHNVSSIYWIDEGTASYMNLWPYNYRSGWKDFFVSTLVFSATNILSFNLKHLDQSLIESWTLFDNAYPNYNFEKHTINHEFFVKVLEESLDNEKIVDFEIGSIVFIQSAYLEVGLLSEEEYMKVHVEAIEKIKKYHENNDIKLYWSLHPKTNIKNEIRRVKKLERLTNISISLIQDNTNIEITAMKNREKKIEYFSLGSSALYVIKAISTKNTTVCLVEIEDLCRKIATQSQLNRLYKSMDIEII